MRAIVLTDNLASPELKGEWGLCIYIEFEDKKILLDAGASPLFAQNAARLDIDLRKIDFAVLSHAHFDHANGMPAFFGINTRAPLYMQSSCAENCYKKPGVFSRYIGIKKGLLRKYADRIVRVQGKFELDKGIYLLSHSTTGLEAKGNAEKMFVKKGGKRQPDDFSHEQSLIFDSARGLVIFNSCSHGGADNIINEALAAFPGKKALALVGGFHLFNKSDEEVRALAERIKQTGIRHIYTGHCTGEHAFDILRQCLGDAAEQIYSGAVMEF